MVFRGTDTIAVLTEWALAEVISNPKMQTQIHKELDHVVGHTRIVQHKDIDQMPNPSVFDPSRLLKDAGGVALDVLGTDLGLAPSGSGRRVCPGRPLGIATAQLWLARLLHHISWSPDSNLPMELTDNLKLSCEMALHLYACAQFAFLSYDLALQPWCQAWSCL